jgi:outer membrane protein TolC
MVVDLPLVDVLFEPLAARQVVQAAAADQAATFNDTLLAVSLAYLDLARAQHLRTVAEEAVRNAEELAGLTADFARAGQGLQADAGRAQVELGARRRNVLRAEEAVAVASAELARLLRLDPSVRLQAVDQQPMPLELVAEQVPLPQLIDQAIAGRPEVARSEAVVGETSARLQQERWRPWTPHLHAGFSTGGFGGGQSSAVKNFSDRTDFDAAAVWEWQNLGFGNRAQQREQDSLHRQAFLAADQTRDLVATEVTQAYERLQSRHRQIEVARPQVQLAREALRQNLEGIRGGVLRPIEIQQALGALAAARQQYLDAVTDYNRAQLEMLRSLGTPPNVASEATPHP